MSRSGVALVALVLLVAVPLVEAVGAPTLTKGDRWVYEIMSGSGGSVSTATMISSVLDANATTVVLESTTWTNSTTPNPLPGQAPITTSSTTKVTQTLRASDLALLVVRTDTSPTPSTGPLSTQTSATSVTRTYDAPCEIWRWPLVVNATWTADCKYSDLSSTPGAQPAPGTWRSEYSVTAHGNVTTGKGVFPAYSITNVTTSGGAAVATQWYAPGVCNVARVTSGTGGSVSMTNLTDFRCASPKPDDYVPPQREETPPPATNTTGNTGTPGNGTDDGAEDVPRDDGTDELPPPVPQEEDDGFLGLPAPGVVALLALVGVAALLARRRA